MTDQQHVVLDNVTIRHELTMTRDLGHPRATVWKAITDPRRLSTWWPFAITHAKMGGSLTFDDGEGTTYLAEITDFVDGRVLEFVEDGADQLRIDLIETAEGTRLVFTHRFDQGPAPERLATGWHQCFDALCATLDGELPANTGRNEALEARYAEALSR